MNDTVAEPSAEQIEETGLSKARQTHASGGQTKSEIPAGITLVELQAQIQSIADELIKALGDRSALEKLLLDTHASAARQRAALESSLDENRAIQRSQDRRIEELRIEAAQATSALGEQVRDLTDQAQSLEQELKAVKRKYRGTQHLLGRERDRLQKAEERSTVAEIALAELRKKTVVRLYLGLLDAAGRVSRRSFDVLPNKQRLHRINLLRESDLFDGNWYLLRYPDVATAGLDPAVHYLEHGWREGRDPSAMFSTSAYLQSNTDVGSAEINPLLHYIEFGAAEGRSVSGGVQSTPNLAIAFDPAFAPPAPCVSFPLKPMATDRWLRSARFQDVDRPLFVLGGKEIGFLENSTVEASLVDAYVTIAAISGTGAGRSSAHEVSESSRLIDAWFVAEDRLRMRWETDRPLVIRAYQISDQSGELALVGEGFATTSLDFVDANLANSFLPLLLVLSTSDGDICGAETLNFPSLCRGGVHYPELVASHRTTEEPFRIVPVSNMLGERLLDIIAGRSEPLIARIETVAAGADGSEPIFRKDFQRWLTVAMKVKVSSFAETEDFGQSPTSARSQTGDRCRSDGGTVTLSADTIPTIGCLVAHVEDGTQADDFNLSLIVAGSEPAQPAVLIEYPMDPTSRAEGFEPSSVWPELEISAGKRLKASFGAVAIRQPRPKTLTESELLVPVAPPALPVAAQPQPITWLVFPEDWESEMLAQGIEALSLQEGHSCLALVGHAERHSFEEIGRSFFGDRVRLYKDVFDALDEVQTPLIGYLGAHVLLHDRRTSQYLAAMLDQPAVVSASCALVSTAKRGNSWSVTIADPGSFSDFEGHEQPLDVRRDEAQWLWRTTYQALRPPKDLWLAKARSGRGWLERAGPLRPGEGVHLCTSLISASVVEGHPDGHTHLRPPAAPSSASLKTETLVG